jgi:FKBP-type peptidyl-prolyl cis-trans isomerase
VVLRSALLAAALALVAVACGSGSGAVECFQRAEVSDSGLSVRDVVCGRGEPAGRGDVVTIAYTGSLLDGRVFDSTEARGGPVSWPLGFGQALAGIEEGISGMRPGGTRELVIPAEIGYGSGGYPGRIPPSSTLVFRVELLEARSARPPG